MPTQAQLNEHMRFWGQNAPGGLGPAFANQASQMYVQPGAGQPPAVTSGWTPRFAEPAPGGGGPLPTGDLDRPVDAIVTPDELIHCSGART